MMERLRFCSLAALSLSVIFVGPGCQLWRVLHPASQPIAVVRLRCEYLTDPMGIETMSPRLSWVLESGRRSQRQIAYEILVASEPNRLSAERADLWNTGKVNSARSVHVEYAGKRLVCGQRCFWKVRVWDKNDQPSDWSDVATWSMGLLESSRWKAQWISFKDDSKLEASQQTMVLSPARYYRKEFEARGEVRRATAYATALGIYELHNTGWSYNLGFLIGLCFSVLAPWRFRPKKKKVVIKTDWDEIGTKIETHIRAAIKEHIDKTKKEDWEQEIDKIVDRIEEKIKKAFEERK